MRNICGIICTYGEMTIRMFNKILWIYIIEENLYYNCKSNNLLRPKINGLNSASNDIIMVHFMHHNNYCFFHDFYQINFVFVFNNII